MIKITFVSFSYRLITIKDSKQNSVYISAAKLRPYQNANVPIMTTETHFKLEIKLSGLEGYMNQVENALNTKAVQPGHVYQ